MAESVYDPTITVPQQVSEELKFLYNETILPVEKAYNYQVFKDLPLTEAEFNAKPLILRKCFHCFLI